jgi:hypothetical protein
LDADRESPEVPITEVRATRLVTALDSDDLDASNHTLLVEIEDADGRTGIGEADSSSAATHAVVSMQGRAEVELGSAVGASRRGSRSGRSAVGQTRRGDRLPGPVRHLTACPRGSGHRAARPGRQAAAATGLPPAGRRPPPAPQALRHHLRRRHRGPLPDCDDGRDARAHDQGDRPRVPRGQDGSGLRSARLRP